MRGFRMLSLGLLVFGALSVGLFCGCEDDPDLDTGDTSYTGGDRDSTSSTAMSITPSATTVTNNGGVVSFNVAGASGAATWSVQDISKGSILTQGARSATYQRAAAGDNVVIATDSRGSAAFATVSQP